MAIFCSFLTVFSKPSTNYELENVARGTLAQCTGKQRCTKLCTVAVSDSRMSHPARYQVTLLLTNVNRVDACGLRQLVLNLPEERRIQNLLVVAVQHPYICPVLIRINIIFYDSEYCPSFRSCWVPSR